MTKKEAIEQMKLGKKVYHRYFTDDEYIYMIGEELYDEHDCFMNSSLFWNTKNTPAWDTDWFIK